MGVRSYLFIKQTKDKYVFLFDCNNSIAVFWLMLLQESDLEKARTLFKKNLGDDNGNSLSIENLDRSDLIIDSDTALKNAKARMSLLNNASDKIKGLYTDWLGLLEKTTMFENKIYLNLILLVGLYKNTDDFIDDLILILKNIDQQKFAFEESISCTSGWIDDDLSSDFMKQSTHYASFKEVQELERNKKLKKVGLDEKTSFYERFKEGLPQYALGIFFAFLLIGIKEEIISYTLAFGLLGLLILYFCFKFLKK